MKLFVAILLLSITYTAAYPYETLSCDFDTSREGIDNYRTTIRGKLSKVLSEIMGLYIYKYYRYGEDELEGN